MPPGTRKLAAIVFADIAGYTAMMQRDEALALAKLNHFETTLHAQADVHHGEIIQFYGDGCLLIFENAQDAVASALAMQLLFLEPHIDVPVRIGIHTGEVVFKDDNVFSDSVNIASRIESMGIPGSVLVSRSTQDQIRNKTQFQLHSLGAFDFKNVDEPLEVFALANQGLHIPGREELQGKFKEDDGSQSRTPILRWAVPALLLVTFLVWQFGLRDPGKSPASGAVYSSLAIFPFTNTSGNADLDYLGDGIAENLIGAVSSRSDMDVISRHSTFALRDSLHNLTFIQKLLNIDAVMVGSIDSTSIGLVFDAELVSAKKEDLRYVALLKEMGFPNN